ncbi:MAG: heavy metal translocating P-type ATPase metal-binding domain-containing protein [Alphaproteobacteria bacterium]
MAACTHCGAVAAGAPDAAGHLFCCPGCAAAHALIESLGLGRFYERRTLGPEPAALKPAADVAPIDVASHVRRDEAGRCRLDLMVDGLSCAACVWLIESALGRQQGVELARVNLTARRLALGWRGAPGEAEQLVDVVRRLGFRLVPYDPARLKSAASEEEARLLRCLVVAGFAMGSVMMFSVALWADVFGEMGPATRDLLRWVSALVALPSVAYAIRPFLAGALRGLAARRLNMDVPITVGVLLTTAISMLETMQGRGESYFEAATSLLFFLLVGRYMDRLARGKARSTVEHLAALRARALTVIEPDGSFRALAPERAAPGMTVFVAPGERIGIDGEVAAGESDVDAGLVTGEATPAPVRPGARVYAGALNLTGALRVRVTAAGEATLLAEIAHLMDAAEGARARYTALADRVARHYAPVVHVLGLSTFLGWLWLSNIGWEGALLNAVAVLIITCPCALALAVPMAQTMASGRLFRRGILLKSATALERVAEADTVVFDKTGTLTLGHPRLVADGVSPDMLRLAASLAASSRHPLAQAVRRAAPDAPALEEVAERPGLGLEARIDGRVIRLGNRRFCGVAEDEAATASELWLAPEGSPPLRFGFEDSLRPDAAETVARLVDKGFKVALLSGDRAPAVEAAARALGIDTWRAAASPEQKCAALRELAEAGHRVLMVGDGLNDAPALAAAHVSLSPASGADISQAAADAVFQGASLFAAIELIETARRARRLVWQNFAIALAYNLVTIPLAVAGFVTPLIAAIAMSSSSLLVVGNALRLGRAGRGRP